MENIASFIFPLSAFFLIVLERFSRVRRGLAPVRSRWLTNVGLMLAGGLVTSLLFATPPIVVATDLPDGFVNGLGMPLWLEAALLILFLDCWIYWQHRVFHEVPLLWRVHLVHHSDTAVDVTTSQRHHPFENIISMLLSLMLVFALGFSPEALGLYLLFAMVSSLVTHANISLPESLDRGLRLWLVTPAVHAMHHSSAAAETNSNYGGVLIIWDRLFGTYCPPSTDRVRYGLEYFRRDRGGTLLATLLQPFQSRLNPPEQGAMPAPQNPAMALSPAWRQALFYGGTGVILTVIVFWPTVLDLVRLWTNIEAYRYGWLVVPVFVYIVAWYRRDSILAMTPRIGYTGLPAMLLAVLLWALCYSTDIMVGQHFALVLMLQGIALCALGGRIYLNLLPVMLLLFLMVPSGDVFQEPLRGLTLVWLKGFATLAGLPYTVDGYRIAINGQRYIVLAACSGLSLFTLAGFLGYSIGLLLFRSLAKVLALAAVGAALGILTNAIRVCLIVALDWRNGTQMDLVGHKDIQWLLLMALVGLLLYLASRLKQDVWLHQGRGAKDAPDMC